MYIYIYINVYVLIYINIYVRNVYIYIYIRFIRLGPARKPPATPLQAAQPLRPGRPENLFRAPVRIWLEYVASI